MMCVYSNENLRRGSNIDICTKQAGANQVAWAFLSGLKCPAASGVLSGYVNSVGQGAGARC
jgi:hypothetical protein